MTAKATCIEQRNIEVVHEAVNGLVDNRYTSFTRSLKTLIIKERDAHNICHVHASAKEQGLGRCNIASKNTLRPMRLRIEGVWYCYI